MPLPGASTQERLEQAGVPGEPLRLALRAFRCAQAAGQLETSTLTLVDYSLPSSARRLWVLDLDTSQVRFHTLVAHGKRSGVHRATTFSNVPGSLQSSLGLFRTGEAYRGLHGYSLRLDGLEPGVNDLALERGIIVHGADYATASFVREHGRLGRSWGCLALDPSLNRDVIDAIRDGSAVFAYYPEQRWLASSELLRCHAGEGDLPAAPPARGGKLGVSRLLR